MRVWINIILLILNKYGVVVTVYTKQTYNKISAWFTARTWRLSALKLVYKLLPLFVFISYPTLLVYLAVTKDTRLLRAVTVPLGVFITVTLIRKFINAKRPYECMDITPLMTKKTKGLSFPSRHTASGAVIAMTFLYINVPLGIMYLLVTAVIGLSRVLAGVHFPRDVAAGYLYSVIMAGIFFYIL